MSDQTKLAKSDDAATNPASSATLGKGKEVESTASLQKDEDKLWVEIKTRSDAIDQEMETKVQEQLKEAKLSHPAPHLSPDVEDAGVTHPETDAEKVVRDGAILTVDVDEKTYKKGLSTAVAGAVKDKVVVGVSSLAALAMWIGRLLKMAHKHTMRVIWRRD